MKIQYWSDLHLEFQENSKWIKEHLPANGADILLLAGDVVTFDVAQRIDWFWDWVADNFTNTYWLPGNHEYYGADIGAPGMTESIRPNIHLVNNASIDLDLVVLHFSTLWTSIPSTDASFIESRMSDFHLIRFNGERFSSDRVNQLHNDSKVFLADSLNRNLSRKNIVVTHHVPTFKNYPSEFYGSQLNSAFAVEMTDFINGAQPMAWIYGHTHRNTPSFKIGETDVLTNQLGYTWLGEGSDFNIKAGLTV